MGENYTASPNIEVPSNISSFSFCSFPPFHRLSPTHLCLPHHHHHHHRLSRAPPGHVSSPVPQVSTPGAPRSRLVPDASRRTPPWHSIASTHSMYAPTSGMYRTSVNLGRQIHSTYIHTPPVCTVWIYDKSASLSMTRTNLIRVVSYSRQGTPVHRTHRIASHRIALHGARLDIPPYICTYVHIFT